MNTIKIVEPGGSAARNRKIMERASVWCFYDGSATSFPAFLHCLWVRLRSPFNLEHEFNLTWFIPVLKFTFLGLKLSLLTLVTVIRLLP